MSLSAFDDYPVHQTSEPLAYPATSDRNFYDRNWFCGFDPQGSYYFGFTLGVYPNRGVIDAGFSIMGTDGVQHCLLASGQAAPGRLPMQVGPVTLEVERPMRRLRVRIEPNDTGVSADLVFSARTAAVREPRQVMWSGTRRTTDATRFNQYGRWSGEVTVPGASFAVDETVCHGVKDRSWGVRILGAPETAGPIKSTRPRFLWSQLFWSDHVSHALAFDDAAGRALVRDAAELPLHPSEEAIPGIEDPDERRLELDRYQVEYEPGTRWARSAEFETVSPDGSHRLVRVTPVLRFQQRGLGYGHREWPHGEWRGGESLQYETIRPAELDPRQRQNVHVQHLVRATDGEREGYGLLEQFIAGAFAPAGFEDDLT